MIEKEYERKELAPYGCRRIYLLPDEEAAAVNSLINAWGYKAPKDFEEDDLWMRLLPTPQKGVYVAKCEKFDVIAVDLEAYKITDHGAFAIRKVFK